MDGEYRVVNPMKGDVLDEAFRGLLIDDFFPRLPGEYYMGAVDDQDLALGLLAFVEEEDRIRITYLYVENMVRGLGVGETLVRGLLDYVEQSMLFMDVEIEFSALAPGMWSFFEGLDFFDLEIKSKTYFLEAEDIDKSPVLKGIVQASKKKSEMIDELPVRIKRGLFTTLKDEPEYIIYDANELQARFEKELCRCFVDKDNQVGSLLLIEKKNEGMLSLAYMKAANPIDAIELLADAFIIYQKKYQGWSLMIEPINDESRRMMKKIFGGNIPSIHNYIATWNYRN